jgi:hypothetical protein
MKTSGTKQKINCNMTREKLSFICGASVKLDHIFPAKSRLELLPVASLSTGVVSVLMHDCPALTASELPQLRELILGILPPVVRAFPSVRCDAHQLGFHVSSVWREGMSHKNYVTVEPADDCVHSSVAIKETWDLKY